MDTHVPGHVSGHVPRPVPAADLARALADLPGWAGDERGIACTWRFADHPAAVAFVVACTPAVEAQAHHPEWRIVYDRVTAVLRTHDAGDQVTARDLTLAPLLSARAAAMGART